MDYVYKFLNKNLIIDEGDNIVIGLSGGPDSMVLLHLLIELKKIKKFNIICAHINHNIRIESEEEKKFVEKYCKDNDLIFEYKKFDYETKFTESLAHNMRYNFFEYIIKKYNAKYLFTAHHGDDLIETILMRLVRGSTIKGYSGFDSVINNDKYTILRPLVYLTKEDIIKYADYNKIPYVIDKSNFSDDYTRNRYRNHILPLLKEEDYNVHLKFLKYSNMMKEYIEYFDNIIQEKYTLYVEDNKIKNNILKNDKKIIIKEVLYKWLFNNYKDDIILINDRHINMIIDMIYNEKPNIIIDIPNYKVIKEYDYIYLLEEINNTEYEYVLEDEVILPNNMKIRINNNCTLTNNYVIYLNSKDIKLPLIIRNAKDGDKMTIKNMIGHKNIKEIFINEKVSKIDRLMHPVVLDSNNNIIWLPGIKKSSFDRKKDENYDIILEYYQ